MLTAQRATNVIGAAVETVVPATKPALSLVKGEKVDWKYQALPAAVGGIAGYMVGKKRGHKWLGALVGSAIGANGYELVKGDHKAATLADISVALAAAVGSLKWKKHRILGAVAGAAVGLGVTGALVPGSTAYNAWHKAK